MRFILTGVADTTSAEKSSLYILDCNNSNGSHFPPPPSPSWRGNEMGSIPENRISTCSRTSSTSTDSRVNYPQSQPQAINANVVVSNYPQRLSLSSSCSHSYGGEPQMLQGPMRQSLHSNSSSSMGSLDVLDESGVACNVNVAELYQQGMTQSDIIYTWLSDMRYEAYLPNFVNAGYDMPTISRMTPEDLTAIGITKPGNRKKLTREISKLNIPDGIPDYLPANTLEWLELLGLVEYYEVLQKQQYNSVEAIQDISWEDLEEIGIHKLGHQKKIMLAIERLKKIMKRQSQGSTPLMGSAPRWSADMGNSALTHSEGSYRTRSVSGDNVSHMRESSPFSLSAPKSISDVVYSRSSKYSHSDIIPIQVKSGLSRSSSGNSINSSSDYAVPRCQSFSNPPERDGTPPSSEDSGSSCSGSMNRSSSKKGPLKGIHGLTMSKHPSQDSIERHSVDGVTQYATLRRSGSRKQSSQSLDFNSPIAPPSPGGKSNATSPALGSLPSPFANFRSPYAQIQSGEVKNQLNKEKRSSSVPSSPVTKTSNSCSILTASTNSQTRRPPAPPRRTMSVRTSNSIDRYNDDAGLDEDQQDFPPPLAPVAFSLEAMKGIHPKTTKTDYVSIEPRLAETRISPAKDSLKLQNVTESNLAARRRAGSTEKEQNSNNNNNMVSLPSNISGSSGSMNSSARSSVERSNSNTPRNSIECIPFANDNAGTIRQKSNHERLAGSSDLLERSMEDALEAEDNDESEINFDTVKRMPKPVMTVQSGITQNMEDQQQHLIKQDKPNVLNDIGSMFETLSTELDALLDEDQQ